MKFIYSILKEILSDDEGCMFVIKLLYEGFSLEDISEFVMRKFLKVIRNIYYFEINEIYNTVVEKDNTVIEENNNLLLKKLILLLLIILIIHLKIILLLKKIIIYC
jgi:hypothetical protein